MPLTLVVGPERGGAQVLKVLHQRGVVQEAEESLVHAVLKHKVVVIVCCRLLDILRRTTPPQLAPVITQEGEAVTHIHHKLLKDKDIVQDLRLQLLKLKHMLKMVRRL